MPGMMLTLCVLGQPGRLELNKSEDTAPAGLDRAATLPESTRSRTNN